MEETHIVQEKFLSYQNSDIRYLRFGEGKKLLIALPGYANEAELYLVLQEVLQKDYTVLALDLPYHGRTQIREEEFRKQDFQTIIQELIKQFPRCEAVEIMGYSYGSRLTLGLFSALPVSRIWLVAGDGLEARRGYNFYPLMLRKFITRIFSEPRGFVHLLKFFRQIRLLPKYSYRFMSHHLGTEANRKRLFGTWLLLHDFKTNRREILRSLQEKKIPITLIYGTKDKIIKPTGGKWLAENYSGAEVHFVDSGHKIFGEELKEVLRYLLDRN